MVEQGLSHENGILSNVDPQTPSADLLGDLLGPLAIEGPPGTDVQSQQNVVSGLENVPNTVEAAAIVPVEEQMNSVQVQVTVIMKTLYCLFEEMSLIRCFVCSELYCSNRNIHQYIHSQLKCT